MQEEKKKKDMPRVREMGVGWGWNNWGTAKKTKVETSRVGKPYKWEAWDRAVGGVLL